MLILKELKGERYLKEILILNSFSFEDKDPRFTWLKPGLAIRLLSKGLLYIRAMIMAKLGTQRNTPETKQNRQENARTLQL